MASPQDQFRNSPAPADPAPSLGACVVTGGAGFVGAATVRGLLAQGRKVLVLDDLSVGRRERLPLEHPGLEFIEVNAAEPGRLAAVIRRSEASQLLHLAGPVGVRRVLLDPAFAESSIGSLGQAVVRELKRLPAEQRPRLFAASTSEVYAEHDGPMAEDATLRAPGGAARWCYALAKRACELRFDEAGLWAAGQEPVHLRLFNVVGPDQDHEGGMVLPTFVARAMGGEALPVHGDGLQQRTYGHVDEVAADLVRLLAMPKVPAGPLNLGGAATASAEELARLVIRLVEQGGGPKGRIEFVDPAADLSGFAEVRRRVPDLGRAQGLGLAQAPRSLEAIVADTLASFVQARALSCASPES